MLLMSWQLVQQAAVQSTVVMMQSRLEYKEAGPELESSSTSREAKHLQPAYLKLACSRPIALVAQRLDPTVGDDWPERC
jgi:hypothetical protein